MLKLNYFLADIFILSAEKQPIKLSWRKIEWLQYDEMFFTFSIRKLYVSRSENECFPHGKRRKTKYKFLFVTMSFYIDEKAKHRDSEVPSINPKGYWKPVAFISKFA